MQFGIFDHLERQDDDVSALYEGRLRMLEAADRGGFYCYHLAEHHSTPLSMSPSPNLVLAAASQRTSQIKLGSLCYILPLYDPMRLAAEICMLDQLTNGRLQVGVSRGVSPIELGFYGLSPATTREIFSEDMAVIHEALTSDRVTYSGKYRNYEDVPVELHPRQAPTPPFWYPTSGLESVPWVAASGFHTCFNGDLTHVRNQVELFREHQPTGAALHYGVSRYVFVGETDEEAFRFGEARFRCHLSHLNHLRNARRSSADGSVPDTAGANVKTPTELRDAIDGGWAAVGSPATVTEQLSAIVEATGVNYIVFNPLLGDTPIERGIANTELFASEVMPAFANR